MSQHHHGADHKKLLPRINRIEGQVKGIKKMIEEEKYCVDVLTQIKAIRSALKSIELIILEGHAEHCLMNAIDSGSKKQTKEKVHEIMEIIKKSNI